MKPTIVDVPSIKDPIKSSPGFAKKELATYKLDLMGLCAAGCAYCSSNAGNYLRINRQRFAELTLAQTGEALLPATSPALSFRWTDFEMRLDEQVRRLRPTTARWGTGETLVFSQLTDGFSPWAVKSGLTRRTLEKVLLKTRFRIRVLTKFDYVGRPEWIEFFKAHPGRFVVGLSIGTLDDNWARRVEIGTSSPSARVRALHRLQDAGVPTFGMLCPIFPDALNGDGVKRLVEAIRPERCETVWSEPYNDRANWRAVAAGYEEGSRARAFLERCFSGDLARLTWSQYASHLYVRVHGALAKHGAEQKHRYLLYQDGLVPAEREALRGAQGVLFQSDETKKKSLPVVSEVGSEA